MNTISKFGGYEDKPWLAELYDFVPFYAGRPDLGFYLEYSRAAGGKILELGCGTGRILIPTASAGCSITGLDLSRHMLARCKDKLQEQPQEVQHRVQLVNANMANFNLNETYTLITTPFRAFQHLLSIKDQLSCLRCANSHLEMGGKLILDLFQVNLRILNQDDYTKETEDFSNCEISKRRTMRRTHRIAARHRADQINDVELIYYLTDPDGREERLVQAFPFRYFFRYEVEHLLARCGFKTIDIFGDFNKSPLKDDSKEMIFVARKEKNEAD